jgi:hypothetical protein
MMIIMVPGRDLIRRCSKVPAAGVWLGRQAGKGVRTTPAMREVSA